MRMANKNKQKLFYALHDAQIPIYEKNADGTTRYITIDGVQVPVETGEYEDGYATPVEFKGNIALSSGEVDVTEFGIDVSNYDAILVVNKSEIPITETSLIWYQSTPIFVDTDELIVDPKSADYRVLAIKPSLNQLKAVLGKITK